MANRRPADRKRSTRRDFLTRASGILAATALGRAALKPARAQTTGVPATGTSRPPARSRPNILFVFTDQERYQQKWPPGLSLPAHERLQRTGTTFTQHYTSAIMCTPSRSVLMTGLQTADNKMFDNCDCPWQNSLSPRVPTIGHMLRKAGYYTAYKGKWHLNKEFDSHQPTKLFTKEME